MNYYNPQSVISVSCQREKITMSERTYIAIDRHTDRLFVGLLYDTYQAAWGKKSYSRKQTDKKEESV